MIFLLTIKAFEVVPSVIKSFLSCQTSKNPFSNPLCLSNTFANKDIDFMSQRNHLWSFEIPTFTPFFILSKSVFENVEITMLGLIFSGKR